MDNNSKNNSILRYNNFHKNNLKKIKHFKALLEYYENINRIILNEENEFNELNNKNNNILVNNKDNIYIITNKIVEIYKIIISNFQNLIKTNIIKIEEYLKIFKEEEIIYNSFDVAYKAFTKVKNNLLEVKNNYHKNGKELESFAINHFKNNELPSNELDNLLNKTKESLNKYKVQLNILEQYKNDSFKKQKDLIEIFNIIENLNYYDIIKEQFKNNMLVNIKMMNQKISDLVKDNKINKKYNLHNFEKIEGLESENLIHYSSKIKLNECTDDKDFLIYDKTIKYIKQYINEENLYPNYEEEKMNYNNPKRKLIIDFFNSENKIEINEKNKNELINIIKDPIYHETFLIIMSKYRIYKNHSKEWIDLMADCLDIILDKSYKDNNFDMIKNCIILAQTYYYKEDKTNEKIFLFAKIKNKNLFKNSLFWKNYINLMIINQLKNIQKSNKNFEGKLAIFISGEGVTDELKHYFGDLLFTQLLTYSNNMIEFNIEKENILDVLNYFNEKYKYLSEDDYKIILLNISKKFNNTDYK